MKRAVLILISLAALFVFAVTALAQSGGPYTLAWFTADGGGGNSSGGSYALGGTIGQPAAGQMSGGAYTLIGGYWGDVSAPVQYNYRVFLPLVVR
jgi:hypothetical protein